MKWKKKKGVNEEGTIPVVYSGHTPCLEHPELQVGEKGILTGGRNEKHALRSDLWIALDDQQLDDIVMCWDSLNKITELDYNGRLIYFPIQDGKIPDDLERMHQIVDLMDDYLSEGKNVHISCIGGHGRTGTIMGVYLAKYIPSIEDPVAWLRENFCDRVVETRVQHKLVNEVRGLPEPDAKEYRVWASSFMGMTPFQSGFCYGSNRWEEEDEKYIEDFGMPLTWDEKQRIRKLCST